MKHLLFFFFLLPAFPDSLHYTIDWPSGLSLGEATLNSDRAGAKANWNFSLDIDAGIPGFSVRDQYKALSTPDLCGLRFDKQFTHGAHKTDEHITFDPQENSVTRETAGGGKSEFSVATCARDPLSFIQFLRQQLSAGRIPPAQQVIYGAIYDVTVQYAGTQSITLGEKKMDADRIVAAIKGPSSDLNIEIFFSRDAGRVPLLAKIPLALGTFSVELQP